MGTGQYVVGYSLDRPLDYWKEAVRAGARGGAGLYEDSIGNEVLAAFDKLVIRGMDWYLVSKVDRSEVTAPILALNRQIAGMGMGMLALVGLAAWVFSRRLSRPILEDVAFARAIADGNYDGALLLDQTDELGKLAQALNRMAESLRNTDWLKSGKEGLDDALRGEHDPVELGRRMVRFLVTHMGATLGAFYRVEGEGLHLESSHAFCDRSGNFNTIAFGEGLVGQAAMEREILHFRNVSGPEAPMVDYGAGEARPAEFMVVPIRFEEEILGVILIGAMEPFSAIRKTFVEEIRETMGVLLNVSRSRATIERLLARAQAQQEELRVANEELAGQTEALRRSERELQMQQEELRVTNEELEEQTRILKESETALQRQQEELRVTNEELEERTRELEGQRNDIRKKNADLVRAQKDVTKKARDLEEASRYKSEFLANMSHELRTPLNSILILSQLLGQNREGNLTGKQVESANAIHSSGSDLLDLINEILDLSKVEAGKIDLQFEAVPLSDVQQDLARIFESVAAQKGLSFDIEVAEGVPLTLRTDHQRLQQILRNLLTNAFKFTHQGRVALSLFMVEDGLADGDGAVLPTLAFAVEDDGIGIPAEKQEAIFAAFQQADGSTSRNYGGTGLGLSISRELVRVLGGRIHLESEVGKGSRFTVWLPVDGPVEEREGGKRSFEEATTIRPPVPPDRTVPWPATKPPVPEEDDRASVSSEDRVLLVIEDDANFSTVMRDFARERGFKCILARDGETGLHLADCYRPSAIILDIGLPGIDGWTVMERLKENPELRHIPVHFMSAEDSSLDALRMGAMGYLTKPASMERIEEAFGRIEALLDRPVRKLLVVEDDAVQQSSIRELIGNGDVETVCVGTGQEALQLLSREPFDCMILDLSLGDMTGFELLGKMGKRVPTARVPVIVYTGRDLSRKEEAELQKHAESIIIKGAKSPERLLDESALFLHRVEANLPVEKQRMLQLVHDRESVLKGKTVLLVDDDMRNVFALSSVLEEKGLEIVVARNGIECLDRLAEGSGIDLVLMDIMMPKMDGFDAMREIRKKDDWATLPIIALTAKAMKGDRSRCIEAGANDYLPKPVNTERLVSMLRVWLYA